MTTCNIFYGREPWFTQETQKEWQMKFSTLSSMLLFLSFQSSHKSSEEDITEPSFSYRKRTERPLVKHKLKTSILGGIRSLSLEQGGCLQLVLIMGVMMSNRGQDQMASSKKNNSYKAYVQYGSITSMCWGIGMHVFLWGRKPEAVCEMGVAVKIPTLILK